MPVLLCQLESLLEQWESDKTLLEPSRFASRTEILDRLDRFLFEPQLQESSPGHDLVRRARAFSALLNAANDQFFAAVRQQIQTGTCPPEFQTFLHQQASAPPRGLAYDFLDDLIAGVFELTPPAAEPCTLEPDSVFYQPTPARHIFRLISAAPVNQADTLVDLGSGLGHVPLLVSICTGATSIGIELDPAWNDAATQCATYLNLHRTTFFTQNAREADLSSGTVFYLYTPFTGSTLVSVLESLRNESSKRPIRVCTFGPCTVEVSTQTWLEPLTPPVEDQVAVFRSSPVN